MGRSTEAKDAVAARLKVDLSGQVAIVTGASQGIGRAIAETLAANGATVALVARNASKIATVAAAIRAAGGAAEEFSCDVSQAESVAAVVDGVVAKFGRVDILVNNAGVTRDTLLPRMSDEEWDEVIATNLRGPFLFMRAVSRPMMQQRYGRIINVASVVGQIGNPGQANYSASKAGLIGMTKALAADHAAQGIRANAICPGTIETPALEARMQASGDYAQTRAAFVARQPLGRFGQADEIASLALYLASDAARFTTGQCHIIDGGWSN